MYRLSAWQVSELAKAYLRGVTSVEDIGDNEYNTILEDQNYTTPNQEQFDVLADEFLQELWDVEEKGM